MRKEPTCISTLMIAGLGYAEAHALRRIAMQLHRWHELECGTDTGAIERDETTGKTYWYNAMSGRRYPTPDRETGALKRLAKIIATHNENNARQAGAGFPGVHGATALSYYVQGDPRGAALYILRPGDIPAGEDVDAYYNRGIAVYA